MDKNIATTHAQTLVRMKHRIRTAFGISTDIFTVDDGCGGSEQGSGASPTACHSQLLAISPGHLILDANNRVSVLQHVISWVDDTVNKVDLPVNHQTQFYIGKIVDILSKWQSIIRITGGDLELSKTVAYLI